MCDTLGRVVNEGLALFAKNSDRSPNEPQVIEYRPARDHREKELRATYLTIKQAPHTYATLLSRPAWMWGAEMGVNEHGVCNGNEAVFTKGRYASAGLTGMDLVRLALERSASAGQAAELIPRLLEQYGQGGDCGYDHSFFYDNAFLILDRREVWLVETAGKKWVRRKVSAGSISNRLSIGAEGDEYSTGAPFDFAGCFREPVYSHFSGSKQRLAQTAPLAAKAESAADMMAALRTHRAGSSSLTKGDVASVCMHAGGLVGDHTTSSMVVELGERVTVWLTGSSPPASPSLCPGSSGPSLRPRCSPRAGRRRPPAGGGSGKPLPAPGWAAPRRRSFTPNGTLWKRSGWHCPPGRSGPAAPGRRPRPSSRSGPPRQSRRAPAGARGAFCAIGKTKTGRWHSRSARW